MSNSLTFYDRQQLEYWLRTKQSLRAIAGLMRRDHSVLVRELKRNGNGNRKRIKKRMESECDCRKDEN